MFTLFAAAFPAASQAQYRSGDSWGGGGGFDSGGSYDYSDACGTSYDSRGSRTLGVIGLTRDQRLVCFNEYSPGSATNIGAVRGFTGGDSALIGIDFRVQDRKLYGVGNFGGVYVIDSTNGNLTFVNRLTVALDGTKFGVDFNPVADRLRIIGENGQNLRHNVNAGGVTVVDATLNYIAGTSAVGVTGAAYTNNDLDPSTATTLYDVDSSLDQVALQVPPNAGTLSATGKLTVDTSRDLGFDIYSTIRNGVTVQVQALASLSLADGTSSLYSITLATGKAVSRGSFGSQNQVIDIAIPLNQL